MKNATLDRLLRWIETPEGKKHIKESERRGEERAAAVAVRQGLADRIEEARRTKREDVPALHAQVTELEAAWQEAQGVADAAKCRWSEARDRAVNLSLTATHVIDHGENLLRRTADPRLVDAAERLRDASANWHHIARGLFVRETVGQFMEAFTRVTNSDDVEALHGELVAAEAAVDALALMPDPEEGEIVRVVAQADAVLARIGRADRARGGAR